MRLKHGHISLELHELRAGTGVPLLLLHALHGSGADWTLPATWRGPVYALDFCGHGQSEWISGGGYYPEILAADADAALAHLGSAALAGKGLGAYVALMVAGARSAQVPAALLLPGDGLNGAGSIPDFGAPFPDFTETIHASSAAFDPFVEMLEHFVRPAAYADALASAAKHVLLVENGAPRPPWWEAVRARANAEVLADDVVEAFARLAQVAGN